jgi:galactose-1-phosphate uridylyltransferase
MSKESDLFLRRLPDGTTKQVNPITGAEVWTVPERAARPFANQSTREPKLIEKRLPEDYCSFCEGLECETTPERSRLVVSGCRTAIKPYVLPHESSENPALFRRISNLFEILSVDYWKKNYGFKLSKDKQAWKERYLDHPKGARHVKDILEYKFRCQSKSEEWIGRNVASNWRELADALFGGSHDLILGKRHYAKGACFVNELASSGEMAPDEHMSFIKYTIDSVKDIYTHNPFVKYASVFQNWLEPAGASFDHLHKQIVGLDESGATLRRVKKLINKEPNLFNDAFVNFAAENNLVFAENKSAIGMVTFGERYPTLAVFSKSSAKFPWELSVAQVRDMSSIIHGCHAAMGADIPCNEEWFYTPQDYEKTIPWYVFLKWRVNNPAGFEGNTEIFINTIDPHAMRERIVKDLLALRKQERITRFRIGDECKTESNVLRYSDK